MKNYKEKIGEIILNDDGKYPANATIADILNLMCDFAKEIAGEDEILKTFEEYSGHSGHMGDFGVYNTVYKIPLLSRNKLRAEQRKRIEDARKRK